MLSACLQIRHCSCVWVIIVIFLLGQISGNEHTHKYSEGESVTLWVNKVGPYNNPQETYNYYFLPFCRPEPKKRLEHKWGGLGEVLQGNELINSQLQISFKENVAKQVICRDTLTALSMRIFKRVIRQHYWYEFFIDDLPVWGFVGDLKWPEGEKAPQELIYLHKHFDIGYNENRIIQVNLTSSNPTLLEENKDIEYTYSVAWSQVDIPFRKRFERYLDINFFEHKIHWFSIFNSFLMVIFLVGLVCMILLRTLSKDYARYAMADDDDLESLERDISEETGWKLVHGDVFRPPSALTLLSALVGTGAQLALLALFVIFTTIVGTLFEERGTIITVFIFCYALTSFFGGYVSGGMFARNDGKKWIPTMLLTASFLPGICFMIAAVINTVAIFYHSLAAVPFGTIVVIILIWAFISFPLCLIGTSIGRRFSGVPDNPCRVKRIPSPIPEKQWFYNPQVIALASGLLPFGSIFIEMYFIFTSFWNYKIYFVYGFMLLVYIILVIVTTCVTIVGTYFLLNAENYHWQWTSWGGGCSVSLYVFLYSVYFFTFKTKMTGLFQTIFYFGYTSMFCLAMGVMCGAVGYAASAVFIRRIYRNIKCD
eukprot:TRINITY_DN14795_c0_g3_i1.p1 TRINITY_DN14795_c0_g3~~TRINITY_DN14795_c0_g3_i1.p1  ORF type:complete len:597 (-),score=48.61 TRINITY_DN14795_c0_g3_i1:439-2229(-)